MAPAVMLTVIAAALAALSVLPARIGAAPRLLAASPAGNAESDIARADILGRPPVRRTTVVKPKPKPPAPRRVAPRAARKRVVEVPPPLPAVDGYVCPVRGPNSFTDDWGAPRGGRRHQGTDLLAPYGTPLVAVVSGTIKVNISPSSGFALYLIGSDGNQYFYAHNARNVATTGQRVATGEVIAYVGNSGNARGGPTHVHFERHPGGGAAVNPYPWLRRLC